MKNIFTFLTILFIAFTSLTAQQGQNGGGITGKVIDKQSGSPMEFANIVVFRTSDEMQINGGVTNEDGIFTIRGIRPGNYYVEISFIGFDKQVIEDVTIERGRIVDLETIILSAHSFDTDEVVVEGGRSPITYEIDKKVISVDEQITGTSGSAVDILETVPSVTVDIEGNVSLRGSSNFRVLIDGRPSILDPADILEQIPASSIENIEIITNPSAKYDPEGSAGIINIVLKKTKRSGYSALAELIGGARNKYGGQLLGEYKTEIYNFTVGLDYRDFTSYGSEEDRRTTSAQNTTYYNDSYGESNRGREQFGLRAEMGLNLSNNDNLSIGGRYRDGNFGSVSTLNYAEWTTADPTRNNFITTTDRERGGASWELFGNYKHDWGGGHELTAEFQYENDRDEEFTIYKEFDGALDISGGQHSAEEGPEWQIESQIDYVRPLGGNAKFEAGYSNEFEDSEESTSLANYSTSASAFVIDPQFNNTTMYDTREHAIYTMYSNEINDFGFQLGIRTENTDRTISLARTGESFSINRWDWFPTFHTSYRLGGGHQVMASYTRRIDRVRGWYLEPFVTWMDANNVRTGNPGLDPEYIDSYEMGYQATIGQYVFSIENYYRVTHNKIERVRSTYVDENDSVYSNVTLHSTENVGQDYSFGTELMLNFDPVKNWNVNLMGNLYHYEVEGKLFGEDFSRSSFNWNLRFINIVNLWEATRFQFIMMYNSPSTSAQGEREGFAMAHLGIRQEFFEGSLAATLSVRDLFSTANWEYTSTAPGYYSYSYRDRESPMVMFNLRWTFNRQGQDRNRGEGQGDGGDMGGEEF